jgi:hypothetical protein
MQRHLGYQFFENAFGHFGGNLVEKVTAKKIYLNCNVWDDE